VQVDIKNAEKIQTTCTRGPTRMRGGDTEKKEIDASLEGI